MAIKIESGLIPPDVKETIEEALTIRPRKRRIGRGARYRGDDSFVFLETKEDSFYVPYAYARHFLQIEPPERPSTKINFTGKLRAQQIPFSEQLLDHTRKQGSAVVSLPTGSGKTILGAWLSTQLNLVTAIVFRPIVIGKQWRVTFERFTDARVEMVGEKVDLDDPRPIQVYLCPISRVGRLSREIVETIGLVILDEAHQLCTQGSVEPLLTFEPSYLIAESATPNREDGQSVMLYNLCGPWEVTASINKKMRVIKINTERFYPMIIRGKIPDWADLVKKVTSDQARDELILPLIEAHAQDRIIIFTLRTLHVDRLVAFLREKGYSVDFMAGKKKGYASCSILVGTVPKIGTGFDEETFCDDFDGQRSSVIILMGSIKNLDRLTQTVGRIFRADNPVVYDLVDSNCILKKHWKNREKWYRRREAELTEASPGCLGELFRDKPLTSSGTPRIC